MNTGVLLYWAFVVLSLYAFYLFAFRLYEMSYPDKYTEERIMFPRIIYLLVLALCFVPVANLLFVIVFIIAGMVGESTNDFYVKSWFFGKPEKKEKADKEE